MALGWTSSLRALIAAAATHTRSIMRLSVRVSDEHHFTLELRGWWTIRAWSSPTRRLVSFPPSERCSSRRGQNEWGGGSRKGHEDVRGVGTARGGSKAPLRKRFICVFFLESNEAQIIWKQWCRRRTSVCPHCKTTPVFPSLWFYVHFGVFNHKRLMEMQKFREKKHLVESAPNSHFFFHFVPFKIFFSHWNLNQVNGCHLVVIHFIWCSWEPVIQGRVLAGSFSSSPLNHKLVFCVLFCHNIHNFMNWGVSKISLKVVHLLLPCVCVCVSPVRFCVFRFLGANRWRVTLTARLSARLSDVKFISCSSGYEQHLFTGLMESHGHPHTHTQMHPL